MRSRWFNVALGVWLVVAALFGSPGTASVNNRLLGLGIFLVAFLAMGIEAFGRVSALLGAWAIVSPFVLGYHDAAAGLNDVAVGILVVATSLPWQRRVDRSPESPAA